ncbi:MAG: glycogen debranching protein GlgX [Yoonia sp.]|nr:glycogen debranching protein GlgX [Yoonia sp.]
MSAGRSSPIGATFDGEGVNFAVFSEHAAEVELCLFDKSGRNEIARIQLLERDGDVWHIYIAGLTPGTCYGYRVHGPYAPEEGHRFNPNKLLLDPYAKRLMGKLDWNDAIMGYTIGAKAADLSFDPRDSADFVQRSVVVDPSFQWGADAPPKASLSDTLIYEAHVKGMTAEFPGLQAGERGKFLGMASEPVLDHLVKLGVTTVQLLPVHAFLDDKFLIDAGLKNFWGYQSIGFFAPEPRYMDQAGIWEFQAMVRRFHAAGIEVILDVVYNHSGEGNHLGPTLSFRGLDNLSYYRLLNEGRYYINDTGTGNTLNVRHPMVLRMIMDSLRYWVEVMHVDGFRFDLATVLGREIEGFNRKDGFLDAISQDPVLSGVKLIAEPWDLGPGGYQLGNWPHPFLEYNDKYRDGIRKFWRGDAGMTAQLGKRLLGSANTFDHSGRAATSSINFVTCHDGMTLRDLVSYNHKYNEDNGEDNRDGKDDNYSANMGIEGPSADPAIEAARAQRQRNILATALLSQGTPMLLSGDEIGNSQGGNNNTFGQDNPIGWVNWDHADEDLLAFVQRLTKLRRDHKVLRQRRFLHARPRHADGKPDVFWRLPSGKVPTREEWESDETKSICVEVRTSSTTPYYSASEDVVFLVVNNDADIVVTMPPIAQGKAWELVLDTSAPKDGPLCITGPSTIIHAASVCVFVLTSVT